MIENVGYAILIGGGLSVLACVSSFFLKEAPAAGDYERLSNVNTSSDDNSIFAKEEKWASISMLDF